MSFLCFNVTLRGGGHHTFHLETDATQLVSSVEPAIRERLEIANHDVLRFISRGHTLAKNSSFIAQNPDIRHDPCVHVLVFPAGDPQLAAAPGDEQVAAAPDDETEQG